MSNLFFVVLPSNIKDYPDNRPNRFRVRLPKPLELRGNYRCALYSIQYPFSWSTTIGTLDEQWIDVVLDEKFGLGDYKSFRIPIAAASLESIDQLAEHLKKSIEREAKKYADIEPLRRKRRAAEPLETIAEEEDGEIVESDGVHCRRKGVKYLCERKEKLTPEQIAEIEKAAVVKLPPEKAALSAEKAVDTKQSEISRKSDATLAAIGLSRPAEGETNKSSVFLSTIGLGAKKAEETKKEEMAKEKEVEKPVEKDADKKTNEENKEKHTEERKTVKEPEVKATVERTPIEETNKSGATLAAIGLARPAKGETTKSDAMLTAIGLPRPAEGEMNKSAATLAAIGLPRPAEGEMNKSAATLAAIGLARPAEGERNKSEAFLTTIGLGKKEGSALEPEKQAEPLPLTSEIARVVGSVGLHYAKDAERFNAIIKHPAISHLTMSDQLAYVLGFPDPQKIGKGEKARYGSDLHGGFSSFAVYARGVTEELIVGNSYSSLLRIVAVDGNARQGSLIEKIYDTPMYLKVQPREISEIEIEVRTMTGEFVPFQYGTVLCTLVFKKVIEL